MKKQLKQQPSEQQSFLASKDLWQIYKNILPESKIQDTTYQFNIQQYKQNAQKQKYTSQLPEHLSSQINIQKLTNHINIDPVIALSYKKIKSQHLQSQSFQKLNTILLQSQLTWLSNLQHIKIQLKQSLSYIKQQYWLSQFQYEQLYNKDDWWYTLIEATKFFIKKLSQAVTNFKGNWIYIGNAIFKALDKVIQQYQIFKSQYIKMGNVMTIINSLQQKIAKQILQSNQLHQKQLKNRLSNTQTQKQTQNSRASLDNIQTKTKQIKSQILQQPQTETKYYFPQHIPQDPQSNNSTLIKIKQQKYQRFLKILRNIRKNILKPLQKLHQFMNNITKYINVFIVLYQNNTKNDLEILQSCRNSVRKLSILYMKIMWNSFQDKYNSEQQKDVAHWVSQKYPQLYYQNLQLDNLSQNNQSQNPFILSFNTFLITFMDIPCQLYLITNYLIIIESTSQNQNIIQINPSSPTKQKLKNRKSKIINELAIIHIDHTTRIQIIANQMLFSDGVIVHITGGMNSNGIFLKFRGKKIQQKYITQHRKYCQQRKSLFDKNSQYFQDIAVTCQVCTGQIIKQWQKDTAISNYSIFKSIINLTISYHTFLYNTLRYSILQIKIPQKFSLICNYPQHSLTNNQSHRRTTIKPTNNTSTFSYYKYNFQQEIIPKDRLLSIKVLAVQHYLINQNQIKYYVIEVTLWNYYVQNITVKPITNNYVAISQIIYLNQSQIIQIQQYIFKTLPTICNSTSPSSLFRTYHTIYHFTQCLQTYLISSTQNYQKIQIQCMIIAQFFNTVFKRQQFRKRPQVICAKLKISQGMWIMLINGVDFYQVQYFQYIIGNNKDLQNNSLKAKKIYARRIDKKCNCQQCILQSVQSSNLPLHSQYQHINIFWKYYNQLLSYPYNENYRIQHNNDCKIKLQNKQQSQHKQSHKIIKNQPNKTQILKIQHKRLTKFIKILAKIQLNFARSKKPYCPIYAHFLQLNYVKYLIQKFADDNKTIKKLNAHQNIVQHFEKIRYVSYLSSNYSIQNNVQNNINNFSSMLINFLIKTHKVRSFNIIIYCLPSIYDYYHQLKQQKIQPNPLFYKQLFNQSTQCTLPQNQGYLQKLLVNIRQNTTGKHLKYIIGQRLGISQQYIMNFMDTYTLVLLQKCVKNSEKTSFISKIFTSKTKQQYIIKEVCILSDHQKIYDILNILNQCENLYYIGLKKLYKIQQPYPIFVSFYQMKNSNDNNYGNNNVKQQKSTKLVQNYYKILQLQMAEICYKINNKQILVNSSQNVFLLKYISLIFAYLHNKMLQKKQKYTQKYTFPLNQKLLIKTGILSKHIFQHYYNFDLQNQQQIIKNKNYTKQQKQQIYRQNHKIRNQRRQQLLKMCAMQIHMKQNQYEIINKILRLVYDQTDWSIHVSQILYIKNIGNQEKFVNGFIFVSNDGVLIRGKDDINKGDQVYSNNDKANSMMFKSVLKSKKKITNQNNLIIQFAYDYLDIEIYGSIVTLIINKNSKQNIQYQKYNLFSSHPFQLYQLIKFYKIFKRLTPIQALLIKQSKIKLKFVKQKIQEQQPQSAEKLKNLQSSSLNFMKSAVQSSIRKSSVYNLQEQFKIKNKKIPNMKKINEPI